MVVGNQDITFTVKNEIAITERTPMPDSSAHNFAVFEHGGMGTLFQFFDTSFERGKRVKQQVIDVFVHQDIPVGGRLKPQTA